MLKLAFFSPALILFLLILCVWLDLENTMNRLYCSQYVFVFIHTWVLSLSHTSVFPL